MPEKGVAAAVDLRNRAIVYQGDCLDLLQAVPDDTVSLVITSPPYNIGKPYEKQLEIETYVEQQQMVARECFRVLKSDGHLCWQTGNLVQGTHIRPLDILLFPVFEKLGLRLRNRVVWHFEHGLHCSRRLSGRYETVLWFTKSDEYFFDLDAIRVPQKYPMKKYFKGPKKGLYSSNPKGKNPGDVWGIPNVKHNHVEKTTHPCQFPVELVERFVLALTREREWVLDPFLGTGTSIVAAVLRNRRGMGSEIDAGYCKIARERVARAIDGTIRTRPMDRPIYQPGGRPRVERKENPSQLQIEVVRA
jgi:adenine-specific DNA-methyltransferase